MSGPTIRQLAVVDAYVRNGHNQTATARALGMQQGGVRTALLAYERWTGTTIIVRGESRRAPHESSADRKRRLLRDELRTEVEAEVAAKYERDWNNRLDRAAEQWDRATALADHLEELVGRVERAVVPVSHRRIADGGVGAKRERKRRAVA